MTEGTSIISKLKDKEFRDELQTKVQDLEGKIDEAKSLIEKYNDKAIEVVTEKPYIAIAGAFAVGYIIGKLAAHRWFV